MLSVNLGNVMLPLNRNAVKLCGLSNNFSKGHLAMLKEGDKAPAFKALDAEGNQVELSDFRGQKVALYFYPKDDTPGCTKEACSFRDSHAKLKRKGINVLGVSLDTGASHKKFAAKY